MEEVRFQYLRPAQITKRRKECSVAYIPLGTLEWHGLHNPMGTDGLQAEEIAVRKEVELHFRRFIGERAAQYHFWKPIRNMGQGLPNVWE